MFNKIAFSNYYLRKRRDLGKDGKASFKFIIPVQVKVFGNNELEKAKEWIGK